MKTILLADDETNLRMLVRTTLEDPQYRILEAVDGAEALALARVERPDLLVLDWMMPGLSGIEVARALRQDAVTASLPIIMLTAKGQETDKEQGRALGTYAYLVKPFSPLELLEKVQEVLTTSTNTADAAEPPAEVRRQLDLADSQLALYVRDLKRTVEAERQ
ncbi:MAG TPA: response regulator, partial [Candidatus Binatia bacterium]|nr:response regulator [Candidatus Binatia bacterium]